MYRAVDLLGNFRFVVTLKDNEVVELLGLASLIRWAALGLRNFVLRKLIVDGQLMVCSSREQLR